MKIGVVKGMRDLLPDDTVWFERLEAAARQVFALHHFEEIRTPVVESADLFARAVGEETDIVGKEMYTFDDKDGARLTLRPEATASTVRAYLEHRLWDRPGLTKLYYMGPMFRRERPQKGRYRQFYQIGVEVMGGDAPYIDFELLAMVEMLLERCGIVGAELVLNSVGCANDRPGYHAALRAALEPVLPSLCADCQRRAQTNPLRVLDCKVSADQPAINALPTIHAYLDEPCRTHYAEVKRLLQEAGIAFREDPRLVRGLDYYTSTAFEFVHGALGAQNALLGGGRYDGLAQGLAQAGAGEGASLPPGAGAGIGFALGEDRFVLAMQAATGQAIASALRAVLIPLSATELDAALALARRLRAEGVRCDVLPPGRKLGKSLALGAKMGAARAVIIGADEAQSHVWQVKNLNSGEQAAVADSELAGQL